MLGAMMVCREQYTYLAEIQFATRLIVLCFVHNGMFHAPHYRDRGWNYKWYGIGTTELF